ncbi:MAG: Hint domain-containing protein [Pseudomonadota bacterium]
MTPFQLERSVHEGEHDDLVGVASGTLVSTQDGDLPVEFLGVGDRVETLNGTLATVRHIAVHKRTCRMVHVSSGSFSLDGLFDAISLPPSQPILVEDWRARFIFGRPKVIVAVERLVDHQFVRRQNLRDVDVFHLFFDKPELVFVGGVYLALPGVDMSAQKIPSGGAGGRASLM